MPNRQHWIAKANLEETRWVEVPDAPLLPGAARLKLDLFALTANNVTYAAIGGPPLHYWRFFPTGEDEQWGRVPVWGFANVVASNVDGLAEGHRVYGYFPIGDYVDVVVGRLRNSTFIDTAEHRQPLASVYNTYHLVGEDPAYDPNYEPQQALFRPLYATGWWLADTLTDGADTKITTALMSSASSKTALATAHALKSRGGVASIGLTSKRNVAFVEGTGLYDQTLSYDDIETLTANGSSAYVDFSGRPELNLRVHTALGNGLARSLVVGLTDWSGDKTQLKLPGPNREFFFVPEVAAARIKAVGPSLNQKMATDLLAFYPASGAFVTPQPGSGINAIDASWRAALEGSIPANHGHVLSI